MQQERPLNLASTWDMKACMTMCCAHILSLVLWSFLLIKALEISYGPLEGNRVNILLIAYQQVTCRVILVWTPSMPIVFLVPKRNFLLVLIRNLLPCFGNSTFPCSHPSQRSILANSTHFSIIPPIAISADHNHMDQE